MTVITKPTCEQRAPSLDSEDDFEEVPKFPGPLMSNDLQKEDLIRFIRWKAQECSAELYKRDHAEAYFLWKIMELIFCRNGKEMMCEVAAVIFKAYSRLRNNFPRFGCPDGERWKEWCLPLADLLCSSAPDDEIREALIKMGDDLASRRWTYAAHICYVVAKVELGSCSQFELIGCDRVPFGLSVLPETFVITETYEYLLSLSSGLAQPSFQIFKLSHVSRVVYFELSLLSAATKYCETIARAAFTFPDRIKRSFIERLILLSCNVLKDQAEEPAWLLELRRLHRTKLANANGDPVQHMASTSHDMDSEIQESECSPRTDEIPALQSPDLEQHAVPRAVLYSRYTLGKVLGMGGYGSVFEGHRIEDGKEVAVKFVDKDDDDDIITIPGETQELPVEVALMKMVSRPPRCSNVLELLEWFEIDNQYVMVLEWPSPCMDLYDFTDLQGGRLSEAQARDVMLQVIRAARHCCDRGVLHCDIKLENLLINTDTLDVKLIDFGCGKLLKDSPYYSFVGTKAFEPPECQMNLKYVGIPVTIWGLGILLFCLICGSYPFESGEDFQHVHLELRPDMSRECFELIMWCLEINPETRPTFADLVRHEWFTEAVQAV
ncbi:PAS domain-containing serine/threonine-protein kinase-like [Ictalurus furcatus]|uniref:PAS domain-containing serine/threonine-protein kinase-like n=1 Tax=Ictalurus furcatus TaxID=66913 RepID=UPI00235063DC|nr:PAS domain-containing serine/threonine-protein kinase-like [Ictalurus furcatus]